MELDDWVLAAHFKKLAAEQLLERAIDLIHHEQNYDEAIRCLHRCLESAPAHEPFFGVHVTAIVHLGLAHIHRNEFEEAIAQLAMIPHGISMQMQHIPLDAIEIFLVMGFEALKVKNYNRAETIYRVIISVTVYHALKVDALIGAAITRYKKEKRPLSWLNSCIKDMELPLMKDPWLPFEIWTKRFLKFGKEHKYSKKIEAAVEELTIAKYIGEVQPCGRTRIHLFKVNKCLAKSFFQLRKVSEAMRLLDACFKVDPDFYKTFWKSQETKGKDEKAKDPDTALGRFTLLSHITPKMPGSDGWKKRIISFHQRLARILIEKKLYEEAVNHLDNVKEYLQLHNGRDEILAEEMKQFGNKLTRSKEHSLAKRVYTNAIDIVPSSNTSLKRDLLSNRSYMNELLGNYNGALSDAKKCEDMFPDWPKAHLRLGRAYLCRKEYQMAFRAFNKCYQLSSSEDRPSILERLLFTRFSTDSEKQRKSMVLPRDSAVDVISKCLASLVTNGSTTAMESIKYLLSDEEYKSQIKADAICLATVMQKSAPSEVVLSLIDKGAILTGTPNALDAFIEQSNVCRQNNEILLRLLEKKVDVSKHIRAIVGEPWQHTLVRLCVKLDKLDALSEVAQSVDFGVKDERQNNVLHVLAKMEYSGTVFNCFKLVTKRAVINPKLRNTDGKKPADFIRMKTDERIKFLEELEKTGGTVAGNKKKKKKKKKKKTDEADSMVVKEKDSERTKGISSDFMDAVVNADEVECDDKAQLGEVTTVKNTKGIDWDILVLIEHFVQVDLDEAPIVTGKEAEEANESPNHIEEPSGNDDVDNVDDLLDGDVSDNEEEVYDGDSFQELGEEFEGLPWDVQCTAEFWKKLKDPRLESNIKVIILRKVKLLASGDWRRRLAIKLPRPQEYTFDVIIHPGIRLYKGRLTKGARLIWEEAIAFSERRSADKSLVWGDNCLIYTDVIRLWDFTLRHDEVPRMIDRISVACTRGQSSTVTKHLKVKHRVKTQDDKRLPRLYYHENQSVTQLKNAASHQIGSSSHLLFFPPASPNDREFHILKFYALSNAMAKCLLQSTGQNFDFPFQVSELEHRIIRLTTEPAASILLLGRSGTGKTTCCLYRLWSKFKAYWENAVTAGAHIPVLQRLIEVDSSEDESLEDQTSAIAEEEEEEEEGSTCLTNGNRVERSDVMACGCRKVCMCAVAAARANHAGILDEEDVTEDSLETGNEKEVDSSIVSEDGEQSVRSDENDNRYRHLRQLFITKNKVLCHEVKKNFRDLCNGLSVAKDHVSHFSEEAVGNLNEIDELSYPLFLGSRDLLLALDATLPGKPFFARLPNRKLLAPIAGWGEKESHLSFLPVSDSEDEEEDEDGAVDKEETEGTTGVKNEKVKRKTNTVKREITYTVFVHEVWPLLEKKSSIGYHPSLVWTEFCSFIKGTVESLLSKNGHMSQEEYHSIGRKKAPTFTGDRHVIYDMFNRYHKICTTKNLFNEFDLLHNIYKRLRANPLQSWLFDEIYVDETQDFTEAELFLLIRCCQDPNRLFFTGDTAQSIMRGVTFRFSDLRSLFFNAKKALSGSKKSPIEVPDTVHQLKYNYRSHKGILKLASSIVHLLGYFFPESFDRLEDDVGLFDGPKPVILETSDFAELAMVLRGARRKTSPIEFGAHQVVLVSSEKSKEDLPEELSCALVLTIYESKGLEFDDVLLYNFFKDSQAQKEWRVVSSYLNTQACKDAIAGIANESSDSAIISKGANDLSFESRPLEFDYNKHKILNSELKQLYTALTRARVNVWIYDEDRESRAPMFSYFDKLGLVVILKLDENAGYSPGEKGMFAEESSTADWEQQGQYFYKKELWNVACKCFEKTHNETMLRRCEAHLQAMKAYKMGMEWRKRKETGSLKSVQMEYVKATECYLKCGMGDEAAICLKNAKEWKLLGELLFKVGKFREAGRYFARAASSTKGMIDDNTLKACESYKKCGDYRNAADILYKSEKYRECIAVMKEYERERSVSRKRLQPPRSTLSIERIVKEAADMCVKRKDMSLLKEYLSELLVEKQLDYVKKKPGCEDIALEILIDNGRAEEAAEIYMRKEKFLLAASCSELYATKGTCFLEESRLIYCKAVNEDEGISEEVKESVLHYLSKSLLYLKNDSSDLADCRLMIGVVTDSLQDLKYAADIYSKCGNYVGALLCQKHLWERGEVASDVIVESLSKMLLLIGRSSSNMKMLQAYFGIEKAASTDGDLYFRINKAKSQLHLGWLSCSDAHIRELWRHFENQYEEEGNFCIISATFPIADSIVDRLMGIYETELQSNAICLQFFQGVTHNNCRLQHGFPSYKTIQSRCNGYCAILQMHGLLRERMVAVLKHDELREHVKGFASLTRFSEKIMLETCHSFYMDLIFFTQYLSRSQCSGMHLVKSLPEMQIVKNQIQWCIQKMWRDAGDKKRFSDTDLFLEIFTMSSYAGIRFIQYEVDNIRVEIKQRYRYLNLPPMNEFALLNKREFRYETFHTMFMDSRLWMHGEGALIEFLHVLLRRGLGVVLRKDVPLPSVINSLMLLEYCVSLCLISLSRTNKDADINLPEFYVEGIQFWSGSYELSFKSKYSALANIQYVSFHSGNNMVKNLMIHILDLLSGKKFSRFDLFHQCFNDTICLQRDPSYRANAERFLILVLVVLSNHRLYSDDPSSARPIVMQLRKYASIDRQAPGFILGALESAARINSPKDAVKVLERLLMQSDRLLVTWNWRTIRKSYLPVVEKDEKPRRVLKLQTEEKPPRFAIKEPTIVQHEVDDNLVHQENESEDSNPQPKSDLSAQDEDDNYFLQESEEKESRIDDAMESEDEKKMEILRGISYEDDDTSELGNSRATLEANERRQNATQKAIRKIQLWWRIVSAIRSKKRGQEEELTNESKIEEHVTKYASDLRCTPCGKRFDTREGLHKHFLQDVRHDQSVINYDKFMQYKKSFVDNWWRKAEELLDREVQGQSIAGQDMAEELSKAIDVLSISMTFIERAAQWSNMWSLKESVDKLQKAYWKLEEEVDKLDDDYRGEGTDGYSKHDEDDDFQLVSRKRKGKKQHSKAQHTGGRKR